MFSHFTFLHFIELCYILSTLILVFKLHNCKIHPLPSFIFIFSYAMYIYVGSILMLGHTDYGKLDKLETTVDYIRLSYLFMLTAYLCTYFIFPQIGYKLYANCSERLTSQNKFTIQLIGTLFLLFSLHYMYSYSGPVLVSIFSGDTNFSYAREKATVGNSLYGFFSVIFMNYLPFVWIILLINKSYKVGFLFMSINFIAFLSTGQKSPVIYILIYFVLSYGFSYKYFPYFKFTLIFGVSILLLISLVVIQNWGIFEGFSFETIYLSIEALLRRTFMTGAYVFNQYIQTFPISHPFLIDIASSVPPSRITYDIFNHDGIAGSLNTAAIGNFYAYYGGLFNVSLLYFPLTILFVLSELLIIKYIRTKPIRLGALVLLSVTGINLSLTDIQTTVPIFFITIIFILGSTIYLSFILNIFSKTKNQIFINLSCNKYLLYFIILIYPYLFQGFIRSFI